MKHLCVTILLLTALLPRVAVGQCYSSQKRPAWVDGYFDERANSYIEMATTTGYSEDDARNRAAQMIISNRSRATGQRVNVQVQNNTIVVAGGGELEVKTRVLDEYRERCGQGEFRVSLLVQTAKNPSFELEAVRVTDVYPFSPRVFVPGMAQLHKGSKGKGVFFIVGEVALIGGVVACEGLRASCESKINTTHNAGDRQTYIDNSDMMQNLRNGFIAGAALLYAWNVIDGIAAKGKKHVQVLSNVNVKMTPFVTSELAGGLSITFNF